MNPRLLSTAQLANPAIDTHDSFLSIMNSILPWPRLRKLILNEAGETPAARLECLLRLYLVQCWFGFRDEAALAALQDSRSIQAFAGFTKRELACPSPSELAEFRQNLEVNSVTQKVRAMVDSYLSANGYSLEAGSHRDPLLIADEEHTATLAPLAEHFMRMARPYELEPILEFNRIYRNVFHELNPAERRVAERYVERLIGSVADPGYIPRIFGVV
ncbi:transposase [Methylotetracoccus oryzae]|uniref:transposase n=1 Tax=Methylotetracoccus oryzae TaxID=1919059 RepID=UPI001119D1D9|nr:transposase [Methylotetracoccus oryzae]